MGTRLIEAKPSTITIGYQPDDGNIAENPPRFTWMPESEKDDIFYQLQISTKPDFSGEDVITVSKIPYNFCTLDRTLKEGHYYWRYGRDSIPSFSKVREFWINGQEAVTPLPKREERYKNIELQHPRIWLTAQRLKEFQEAVKKDSNYCGFADFVKKSAMEYAKEAFVQEPDFYPGHKRVVELWRKNYQTCQKALEYIRSLSVAGRVLEREDFLNLAKEALLQIVTWNCNGSTSRDYHDECSFRVAYAIAFGYDWLYDLLTKEERKQIQSCLFTRVKQVADHIMIESRVHVALYDSHAVRSLSSVITPCCIAILGECEKARDWLDYAIEYFSVLYTPWGGVDGGWAEGGMYWTSGMAFVIDALNAIKSYLGIDLYQRPFFQKTGDFPLYCMPVDTYRASFCDQSNLGKYPGWKTAYNMRQFAGITGRDAYQWYYKQVLLREEEPDPDFFNKGWWDFAYDDMVYRSEYGEKELKEYKIEQVKWFQDIGWVAIHRDLKNPKDHIFLLTKSSSYGSVSHSHGDQNSFLLFAFGEPLLIESGYYIGFNTSMHRDWRRQTKSQNTLLINGKGQYAGMDKTKQLAATGRICEVKEEKNFIYVREDATQAYQIEVPELVGYQREIYFVDGTYFVVIDTVQISENVQVEVDWLLHSLYPFFIKEKYFCIEGEKANLKGQIVFSSAGVEEITQTDAFEGVNLDEIQGCERQWHLTMRTGKSGFHKVIALLIPEKKQERQLVTCMRDDQGMDVTFYFSCNGNTFSLEVDMDADTNRTINELMYRRK